MKRIVVLAGVLTTMATQAIGPKGSISVDTVSSLAAKSNSFTATFDRSGKPCPVGL